MKRTITILCAGVFLISLGATQTPGARKPSAQKTARSVVKGIPMRLLPAGNFLMGNDYIPGAPNDPVNRFYPDEQPVHKVTLSSFWMGETEVTQAQYRAVTGKNPSAVAGDDLPVTNVSANEAIVFCNLLSKAAGLAPCYDEKTGTCDFSKNGFRLPTEAEWEYSCRAGTRTHFSSGNTVADLDRAGWYAGNNGGKIRPVAKKVPNPWGLFDLHGNVFEFCYDGFDETYHAGNYRPEPRTNPTGHGNFNLRIMRGGGWASNPSECRSAARGCFWTGGGASYLGFRVARSVQ